MEWGTARGHSEKTIGEGGQFLGGRTNRGGAKGGRKDIRRKKDKQGKRRKTN